MAFWRGLLVVGEVEKDSGLVVSVFRRDAEAVVQGVLAVEDLADAESDLFGVNDMLL